MPLKVLSVAFPFAPVGPRGVGGAEQILAELDRALVESGQQSTVIACQGSETAGRLVPVPLSTTLEETARDATRKHVQAALEEEVRSEHPDLVHMHGFDFHAYRMPEGVPVLVTLHLPIAWYPAAAWTSIRQPVQFCCVSESQRRRGGTPLFSARVIENGVDIPPAHNGSRRNYAVVLGRICPEKNAHEALEAGTRAGVSVILAGEVFPYREHEAYFREKIEPLLPSDGTVQHRFVGPVSPKERDRLLAGARCLLHPTLAPETSSLVAMEALAAATPVIAYPSGALPDIIEDGVTGFLVNDANTMAAAIARTDAISPEACRQAALERFNRETMVRHYMELYRAMANAAQPEVLHA